MKDLWRVDGGKPRPCRHYPATPYQFAEWFSTKRRARAYFEAVRWRAGFVCPFCGGTEHCRAGQSWWCPACRRHVSLTAGSALDKSHVPVRAWLEAACCSRRRRSASRR